MDANAAIQQFAFALKQFITLDKNISSTRTLLDATETLQQAIPEAQGPLSILITNLRMRMAKFAAREAFQQPSSAPQLDQGEGTTDFMQTLLPNEEKSSFQKIIGYAEVKQRLCRLVLEPLVDPIWFKGGVRTGVVLYGSGGTGKSMFAKAIAGESGKPTFFITEANIQSKFVGGSQRNVKALLDTVAEVARRPENNGAIIFFEEIDTLFGGTSEYGKAVNNEFKSRRDMILKLNIATVGATNHPGSLKETGIRRRLGQSIYVGLPSLKEKTRPPAIVKCVGKEIEKDFSTKDMYAILKFYMKETGTCGQVPEITMVQFDELVADFHLFKQFTSDNLRTLVEMAEGLNPLGRNHYRELYYCPQPDGTFKPSLQKTSPDCIQYNTKWTQAQVDKICWPPVDVESIRTILSRNEIAPTTSIEDLKEYKEYAEWMKDGVSVERIEEDIGKFEPQKPAQSSPVFEKKEPPKPKQGWFGVY